MLVDAVQPDNILLESPYDGGKRPIVKLADMGMAKKGSDGPSWTEEEATLHAPCPRYEHLCTCL